MTAMTAFLPFVPGSWTNWIWLGAACLVGARFAWGVVKSRRFSRIEEARTRAWYDETRNYQMQEAARFLPFHRVERIATKCAGKDWRN